MDYYSQKLFLAKINQEDKILGRIERWKAHEKGVLHRGFTVTLFYNNQVVLQHRKHPVFDHFWDLTFSSHPIYISNNQLQTMTQAIYQTLKREWHLDKKGLNNKPKFLGKIYYQACDSKTNLIEHEIDYIFSAEVKTKPKPNLKYAYGYKLVDKSKIRNLKFKINLAPWVKKILDSKIISIGR